MYIYALVILYSSLSACLQVRNRELHRQVTKLSKGVKKSVLESITSSNWKRPACTFETKQNWFYLFSFFVWAEYLSLCTVIYVRIVVLKNINCEMRGTCRYVVLKENTFTPSSSKNSSLCPICCYKRLLHRAWPQLWGFARYAVFMARSCFLYTWRFCWRLVAVWAVQFCTSKGHVHCHRHLLLSAVRVVDPMVCAGSWLREVKTEMTAFELSGLASFMSAPWALTLTRTHEIHVLVPLEACAAA